MNLAFLRQRYSYYSTKASDIVRQLAFAGIALIWVFKTQVGDQWLIPAELFPAAITIVIALLLDFLQYVVGAVIWGGYHRLKERSGTTEEAEFLAPRHINWLTLTLFWAKVSTIIVAYGLFIRFLFNRTALSG